MTNIIKISTLLSFVIVALFAFNAFSATAFAWAGGTDDGQGGCCEGGRDNDPTPTPPEREREPQPPMCNALTADKTTLPFGGGNVTLTWSTTRGTSATLTPDGSAVVVNGSKTVSVTADTTFVLRVKNSDGSANCQVKVNVEPPVVVQPPKCDAFSLSPATLPHGGGNVTLSWATTDAGTVSINNGVGVVTADGSKTVPVTQNTTFTLTASKVGQSDATCTASVTVANPQVISCANNVNFSGSPTSLPHGGGTVNLNWSTTGLSNVAISNTSATGNSGNISVGVSNDTTFTLTGSAQGQSVNCPLSVDVADPSGGGGGGGGGSSSPKCELDISDKKIKKGQEVELKWETTKATEVSIKDNHGKTIIDTDDLDSDEKKDFYDGEIDVRPTKDTTYTLTAEKGSKKRTCKVSVDVENDITVIEVRDQVAGIKLTQVPYTGFEAGPILTYIFYTLLALWGLFIAYVLVLKKKVS